MKTFLRFLGNLATVIIAFVLYTLLQLGYAQKKVNLLFAIILAVLTVAVIYWMYWIYKRELKQENDWVFNAKPHWDVRRVIISVAAFFVLVIFQVAYIKLVGGNAVSQNQAEIDEVRKVASPMFNVLLIVVAPICEELIFRALFFNTFLPADNTLNKWVGIVASGFVFAYGHDPMFSKFIYLYWVMGMILAWTYVETKDIRYSILTHMLNNILSIL
ncbi:CPBP family intramembrane glutamic endopeptidase [Lactobacillus taiwanensis]|uniref:CPBP family intramembrane glutamic endopeptidase n=1 Tax=Lactobacillus taiwanensis TaxID=508451 RepID=UPI001AEBD4C0|nr:type II CAAX endopeptidase family protein [Lactobacillus taiwanensis]QTQ39890.1 CPBP family intramembrane metalloprotease [Lactobacillus taiwanensis]